MKDYLDGNVIFLGGHLSVALESLDQLKSVLKIVAALADGALSVPGLRAAAGAAIEIIEIAQAVTKNREDAIDVAKSAAERTSSLLDAFKGKSQADIPVYVQEDIVRYSEKLERVQQILYAHSTQSSLWRRILARGSRRDEITKCKNILSDAFQVFAVSLSLKVHTHLPDLLQQLRCLAAPAAKLSIIRREELDLREYWRLDGNVVDFAEYNGRCVVVRQYGTDKKQWATDMDRWLEPHTWRSHYLQVIGQSEESACGLHLVFQDPGVPVQAYLQKECQRNVKKCTLEVLTMVVQFASATGELLRKDRGGCKLDTAQVCLRRTTSNTMNRANFVLAHFDPSHFFVSSANDDKIAADGWEVFVDLITKAITGDLSKPNYVIGRHGETGPTVTRAFRFLIHFLIDSRYHPDRQHDGLDQTFRKLESEMKSLQRDVETLEPPHSSSPLLDSMQRYYSNLCAIWDLWDLLPVAPGDVGVMIPGDDPKRPRFQKISNIGVKIQEWSKDQGLTVPISRSYPIEYTEERYISSDGNASSYWTSEVVDAATIRHIFRLGNVPAICNSWFGFARARMISHLGDSMDNYKASWSYFRHIHDTGELLALATQHGLHPQDLILIFSTSQSKGYTHLMLETLLAKSGAKDGILYYFENLTAAEGELCGYWSAAEAPGHPLWGVHSRAEGSEWAWEYSDEDFKVEIGRKGPAQHIRYLSL